MPAPPAPRRWIGNLLSGSMCVISRLRHVILTIPAISFAPRHRTALLWRVPLQSHGIRSSGLPWGRAISRAPVAVENADFWEILSGEFHRPVFDMIRFPKSIISSAQHFKAIADAVIKAVNSQFKGSRKVDVTQACRPRSRLPW